MRRIRYAAYGLLALVGGVIVLALGERALAGGDVLHGVRLAGVSVSGRDVDDARDAIARHARSLEQNRFRATAGGVTFTFTAGDVGLVVNHEEATAAVGRAGRRGHIVAQAAGAVLRRFRPDELSLEVTHDPERLEGTLKRWATSFDQVPTDGTVAIDGGAVSEVAPVNGRKLDRAAAATLIRRALAGNGGSDLDLPVEVTPPAIGAAEVARVAGEARKVLSGPATIVVEGKELALGAAPLGGLLDVAADGERLRLDLPAKELHDALRPQLAGLEVEARDAKFVVEQPPAPAPPDPAAPPADPTAAPVVAPVPPPPPVIRIEESATGKELDAAAVAEALLLGEHRVEATLREVAPRVDTERARTLRIIEPVSTFTTHHPAGQPRVKNIHRIADLVHGTVILPDEQFSLNEVAGPRTRANGFVKAPVIYDGEFTEDIGGGVSQFATTFFNAAFFGGYELVSHKAHTFYISRYPMGREATVSYPAPDLVIRNDSTSGILVQTSYTPSSITVTFWGDKEGRTVRAEGPRVGKRTGKGFPVTVTRVIERPGAEPVRQQISTYYRSQAKARPRAPRPRGPGTPTVPAAPAPAPPAPPPEPVATPEG